MYIDSTIPEAHVARFWQRVEITESCWLWRGYIAPNGYGKFKYKESPITVNRLAHRVAYSMLVGPIREWTLDHLCRTRNCVNPDHLEPVTQRENNLRGIGFAALNAKKTECLRGHSLLDVSNVRVDRRGCRNCRECGRMAKIRARSNT